MGIKMGLMRAHAAERVAKGVASGAGRATSNAGRSAAFGERFAGMKHKKLVLGGAGAMVAAQMTQGHLSKKRNVQGHGRVSGGASSGSTGEVVGRSMGGYTSLK